MIVNLVIAATGFPSFAALSPHALPFFYEIAIEHVSEIIVCESIFLIMEISLGKIKKILQETQKIRNPPETGEK